MHASCRKLYLLKKITVPGIRLLLLCVWALCICLCFDLSNVFQREDTNAMVAYNIQTIERQRRNWLVKSRRGTPIPPQKQFKEYKIANCNCSRTGLDVTEIGFADHSTCSDFATQRGDHKVVAYSYFNPEVSFANDSKHYKKYLKLLPRRAVEVKNRLQGWTLRLYHNMSHEDVPGNEMLCSLSCAHDHVDLCNVTSLPTLGNLLKKQPAGRLWRLAVMGDPTVSVFNIRNIESLILTREEFAIKDWMKSKKTFHVMRDHPEHKSVISTGRWGCKNGNDLTQMEALRNKVFSKPFPNDKETEVLFLKKYIWPLVKVDGMQHDSYTCQIDTHANSIPFPTKRLKFFYVGCNHLAGPDREVLERTACPETCRPPEHKNWTYC